MYKTDIMYRKKYAKYCMIVKVLFTVFGLLQGSKPTSSTLYATTSSLFGSIDQVVPETSSNNVKRQKSCVFDSSCDVQKKSVNKDTVAFFTYYETYPAICPDSPSYNPSISADDCADLSCCEFSGDLAAVGHKPIDFVKNNNMVAFYDSSDPDGLYWTEAYANKTIEVSKTFNGRKYIFNATILDNCVNSDCDDCCIKDSASTGYLLVMEYFTVMRNFGSVAAVDGLISFRIFH